MTELRGGARKAASCLLALSVLMGVALPTAAADEAGDGNPAAAASGAGAVGLTYTEFLQETMLQPVSTETTVELDADQLVAGSGDFTIEDGAVYIKEENSLTVSFPASPGLYAMRIEYDPDPGRSRDIELRLELQGGLPYQEADSLVLSRRWRDVGGVIEEDNNGNDIRPSQEEILFDERGWLSYQAVDASGYYTQELLFPLEDENTLTLTLSRENVRIHRIVFYGLEDVPSYAEYADRYKDVPDASSSLPTIEAELSAWKSDARLVAFADRSSPITSPYKGAKVSLNTIGGDNWVNAGQTIAWSFTPEETGMYEIRLRCRQHYVRGFYSTRTLRIDGSIPFEEAANLRFTYDRDWKNYVVSADDMPCRFYFEAGHTYTLSLTMTLGDFGASLGRAQESVQKLNDIYRELLMIMGASPDSLRDYNLDEAIPDTIEEMRVQADSLDALSDEIRSIAGFSGSELALLDKVSEQLRDFYEDPREIAERLNTFKDNIAALNTWILDAQTLPLDLDTISITAPSAPLPKADAGFWGSFVHQMRMFFSSFVEDYNSLGGTMLEGGQTLKVWTTTGRDQATILNDLIRSTYSTTVTQRLGKPVNVELQVITADTILPSVAAGNGADVLLNAAISLPVNYATRGAAYDLREAASDEQLEEVLSHFRDSALTSLAFNGGLYALPEQQTWPVLFYRTDILEELNIPVPDLDNPWTWDDVIRYLPVLQKNNMTFLMDTGIAAGTEALGTFAMFLFQREGEFYNGEGVSSALDSEVAISAFECWTQFYTSYGLPTNFSIANRFRTGEAPLAIADMSLYNQLAVSAPEISGLWGIGLVPGTVQDDGTVDHSVSTGGTAAMLMATIQDPEVGWDFLSWWTSTDVQMAFAREMESLLGTSARYPSANVEAMEQLPWSLRDLRVLQAQAQWAEGIPEVPGGYYTSRHIKNAFREVCVGTTGEDPRETMLRYAKIINDELYDKRVEFGLDTAG